MAKRRVEETHRRDASSPRSHHPQSRELSRARTTRTTGEDGLDVGLGRRFLSGELRLRREPIDRRRRRQSFIRSGARASKSPSRAARAHPRARARARLATPSTPSTERRARWKTRSRTPTRVETPARSHRAPWRRTRALEPSRDPRSVDARPRTNKKAATYFIRAVRWY